MNQRICQVPISPKNLKYMWTNYFLFFLLIRNTVLPPTWPGHMNLNPRGRFIILQILSPKSAFDFHSRVSSGALSPPCFSKWHPLRLPHPLQAHQQAPYVLTPCIALRALPPRLCFSDDGGLPLLTLVQWFLPLHSPHADKHNIDTQIRSRHLSVVFHQKRSDLFMMTYRMIRPLLTFPSSKNCQGLLFQFLRLTGFLPTMQTLQMLKNRLQLLISHLWNGAQGTRWWIMVLTANYKKRWNREAYCF